MVLYIHNSKGDLSMVNKFLPDYYAVVKEHAVDMVNDIYYDLFDVLEDSYHGYSFQTWERLNEKFFNEYNHDISISLIEAIEILEQSKRIIADESYYISVNDYREQIITKAYWTYRNDLIAEFKQALKERLNEEIPALESKIKEFENQITILQDKKVKTEKLIEDFENKLSNKNNHSIEEEIEIQNLLLENIDIQLDNINEDLEYVSNLLENINTVKGEL